MNKEYILFKIFLINFSRINEIKEINKTKKRSIFLLWIGIFIAVILICVYNALVAQKLSFINQQNLIPPYMVSISSFSILFLTISYSNDLLFNGRDIKQLLPLPISKIDIIKSKFMFIYIFAFIITFLFMFPGGIIWFLNANFDIYNFTLYFLSILFVPLIPTIIASIMGISILLFSNLKTNNFLVLIFSLCIIGLTMFWVIYSQQTNSSVANIGVGLSNQVIKLYPLSIFFSSTLIKSLSAGILLFIIISIIMFFLFIKIVSLKFEEIISLKEKNLTTAKNKKNISKKRLPILALYKKDLKRFIDSYMTVLNTGLGVIILITFSVIIIIMPIQNIGDYIGIKDISEFLANYAPILVSSFLCLSCTTSYSISLEGGTIWILQNAPIKMKDILNSKLAVNVTIHALGYFTAIIAFIIKIKMSPIQFISILVIPIIYSIFISNIGLFLNKKYPNFVWDNEMLIVKQSLPVIFTGIIGAIAIVIPVVINFISSISITYTVWIFSLFLIVLTFYTYRSMNKDSYI